ncbi:hypothetical protein M3Y14_17280 [Bacillus thuringiensis]|uniref:hypothetical protein n=1 Tax=Bacillus thuringiensis TaxID=1428 RepID=UPI0022243109|nr:hypothetical protein [Bacillus thuringiensis]UYX50314.1 hypothetical protein M3Y14_17280 [Bacillus thuringiensis]
MYMLLFWRQVVKNIEKGFSYIELLRQDKLQDVIERIENKQQYSYDPNGIE